MAYKNIFDCQNKIIECNLSNMDDFVGVCSSLRVAYLNARSIKNKMDEIENIIKKIDAHIVAITETWTDIGDEIFYNIDGYQSYFVSRRKIGGGVCLLVKTNIMSTVIFEQNDDLVTILGVRITNLDRSTLNILVVYKAPSCTFSEFISLFKAATKCTKARCIILGDFNIDINTVNHKSSDYINFLHTCNLCVINKSFNTRIDSKHSSLIDHIITNFDITARITNIDDSPSDHNILVLEHLNVMKNLKNNRDPVKFVTKTNFKQFIHIMSSHVFSITDNVNSNFNNFFEIIQSNVNKCKYTNKTKSSDKRTLSDVIWFDSHLGNLIKSRNRAHLAWKANPTDHALIQTKKIARNAVTVYRRKIKYKYYNDLLASFANDQRKTWSVLNAIMNNSHMSTNKDVIKKLICNGKEISDSKEMANELNKFFISVGSNLAEQFSVTRNDALTIEGAQRPNRSFYFYKVNNNEIAKLIDGLKTNSSPGVDGITVKTIKYIKDVVSPHLSSLINMAIDEGIFPDCLKVARVVPIYKGDDKQSPTNYRPISVLPIICKIFEIVMFIRLNNYVNDLGYLSRYQYGFRAKSNTNYAIFDLITNIQQQLDCKYKTAAIFIDLRKAFDTIAYDLLLRKLEFLGVVGPSLKLFSSYLNNRKQVVNINGVFSDISTTSCGVPQGSILGPLLFNIYINDITDLPLKGSIQLYADDTLILYKAGDMSELQAMMQYDIDIIYNWLISNKLSINESKTSYMIFNNKQDLSINVNLNGKSITQTRVTKYLGLLIDEDLNFHRHIESIANKITPIAKIFYRFNDILSFNTKLNLYYAHIHSHLTYLSNVWGCTSGYKIMQLQRVQNMAIKNLLKLPFLTSTKLLYENTNILPVNIICKYNLILLTRNLLEGKSIINTKFKYNEEIHEHNTRIAKNIHLPQASSAKYGTNSLKYNAFKTFNALPSSIKNNNNEIKRHLLNEFLQT